MSARSLPAKVNAWVAHPLSPEVVAALERLTSLADVAKVAVMPDVHLAEDVCIGTVVATRSLLLPAAVGGDIGCGMAAVAFDADADLLRDEQRAATILAGLYQRIPTVRHPAAETAELPAALAEAELSTGTLERLKHREGRAELGTLGRGNHFVELQAADDGGLWLMLHSGSRAMGQAIRDHHVRLAETRAGDFASIPAESDAGRAYLADMAWALNYADASRRAMVTSVAEVMMEAFGVETLWSTYMGCQHNHARREEHGGESWLVHRKGAISADEGQPGIIPGLMGSPSYHVVGRGCPDSLRSSSHGAGRTMSRTEARRQISVRRFERELQGVWYDHRLSGRLRDEAPSAYKDVRQTMRAQAELTSIVRTLRPLLSYKGA